MTRLALLLRGINVGGNNKIAMADLRALLAGLGYADPKTLLNSGNAFVTTDQTPEAVEQQVQKAIKSELGLTIETLARTHDELSEILRKDPLNGVANDPSRYAVVFLRSAPETAGLDTFNAIDMKAYEPETCKLVDRELYVWYADGQARTKLTGTFWERKLKVTATARNWNTLIKLHDLTES